MTEEPSDPADAMSPEPQKRPGERLAKAIARAGLGSRRDAEEQAPVGTSDSTVPVAPEGAPPSSLGGDAPGGTPPATGPGNAPGPGKGPTW